MAPPTKLGPLDEKEKVEFDNIRYDDIRECKDVKKLMRLEAYMRAEGFPTTADYATARLRELGQRAANDEVDPQLARQLAEERARASVEIAAWTAKQKEMDASLGAVSREGLSSASGVSFPPVRNPTRQSDVAAFPPAAKQQRQPSSSLSSSSSAKTDSAVGTQVRSGREYYERWEKKAAAALEELDRNRDDSSSTQPGAAATAASTAGLARSPELTQRLLDLNSGASPAERLLLSAAEKAKGNEHFRAKEYAEAVERYTLALGLRGTVGEASLFANRAASYIKLKMWDAAEQDASAALEATAAGDVSAVKPYIRRAMARLELGRPAEALVDCDAALRLQPGCAEAVTLRDRAVKVLGDVGMRRMVIEEEEDDEEEEEGHEGEVKVVLSAEDTGTSSSSQQQSQEQEGVGAAAMQKAVLNGSDQQPQQQLTVESQQVVSGEGAAVAAPRRRLVVVEESESSESDNEEKEAKDPKQQQPPAHVEKQPRTNGHHHIGGVMTPAAAAGGVADGSVAALQEVVQQPPAAGAPVVADTIPTPPITAVAAPAEEAVGSPASVVASPAPPTTANTTTTPPPPPPSPLPQPPLVANVTAASPLSPPPPPPPKPQPPSPTTDYAFEAEVTAIKDAGNAAFKSGNYREAEVRYTEALQLAPDWAALYINRCMARTHLEDGQGALRDAADATALDPDNVKALHKRARAKALLRLWQMACEDLRLCLELMGPQDRSRADVARELAAMEGKVAEAEERRAAREAAAAARPQRITQYARARVTIEEHDEPEAESADEAPLLAPQDAALQEATALSRLTKLQQLADNRRLDWLAKADKMATAEYRTQLQEWDAAVATAAAAAAAAAQAAQAAAATAVAPPAATPHSNAVTGPGSSVPPPKDPQPQVAVPQISGQAPPTHQAPPATSPQLPGGNVVAQVEAMKNEGNEHFRAKRFHEAESCYFRCLDLDPNSIPVHLNLLATMNETRRYGAAEQQAERVLQLLVTSGATLTPEQSTNMRSKVFHRRATARRALGRLEEAQEDLRAARALLGQSPALDTELESLGRQMAAEREAAAERAVGSQVTAAAANGVAVDKEQGREQMEGGKGLGEPPAAAVVPVVVATASEAASGADGAAQERTAAAAQVADKGPVIVPRVIAPSTAAASRLSNEPAASAPPTAPAAAAAAAPNGGGVSSSGSVGLKAVPAAPVRRRMVVVEVDDESEEEEEEKKAPPASPARTPVPAAPSDNAPSTEGGAQTISIPAHAPESPSNQSATTTATSASSPAQVSTVLPPPPPPATITTPTPTPPNPPSTPGDVEATRLRKEGNRLFGAGNYARAGQLYSASIAACGHNPAAYCNRSLVHLFLNRPAEALRDAELAIAQAPADYPKARLRKVMALGELGRPVEALEVLRPLMAENPGDPELMSQMVKWEKAAAEMRGNNAVAAAGAAAGTGAPAKVVVGQAPAAATTVALQQPHVQPVGAAAPTRVAPTANCRVGTSAPAANGGGHPVVVEEQAVTAAQGTHATDGPSVSPSSTSSQQQHPATPLHGANSITSSSSSASSATAASHPVVPPTTAGRTSSNSLHEVACAKAAAALASKTPKKPKPPKNAHELEQALKSLSGHTDVLHEYVRSLDPASYASVIKANLSTKMISAFVESVRAVLGLETTAAAGATHTPGGAAAALQSVAVVADEGAVEYAVRSLEGLTMVPRFDMTYGLCGKGLKEEVRAIADVLAASGRDVSLLQKSYKL